MSFLKKNILFALLFFCAIGLFVNCKSTLKKAVKNSEGYFYNAETAHLMYINLTDYGDLMTMQSYYPHFNPYRLAEAGRSHISIDNNPVKRLREILDFSPEKGKIISFKDRKDIYSCGGFNTRRSSATLCVACSASGLLIIRFPNPIPPLNGCLIL